MLGSTLATHDSVLETTNFTVRLQKRQDLQVACPEEIAFRQGWINADQLAALADPLKKKPLRTIPTQPAEVN